MPVRIAKETSSILDDKPVEVHVEIPEHLTEDQQEAFKTFAEKAGLKY